MVERSAKYYYKHIAINIQTENFFPKLLQNENDKLQLNINYD